VTTSLQKSLSRGSPSMHCDSSSYKISSGTFPNVLEAERKSVKFQARLFPSLRTKAFTATFATSSFSPRENTSAIRISCSICEPPTTRMQFRSLEESTHDTNSVRRSFGKNDVTTSSKYPGDI